MKIEFLTGLGVAEDVAKKIVAQSDKDTATVQQQLTDANTAIQSYKDMDIEGVKKSVEDYKQKLEQSETDRKAFEHKTKITDYVKSLGLKDDIYEKHISDTLIEKGLQFEGDKLVGGEDIVTAFRNTHAEAFKPSPAERTATSTSLNPLPTGGSGVETAFYAKNPELKI